MQWEFPLISLIKKIKTFLSAAPIYFWSVVKTPLNLGWESNCQKVEQSWFYQFPTHTLMHLSQRLMHPSHNKVFETKQSLLHSSLTVPLGPYGWWGIQLINLLEVSVRLFKTRQGKNWKLVIWEGVEELWGWRMFWRLGCWSGDVPSPPFDQTPASLLTVNRLWSTTASTVSTPTKFLTGT